MCRCTPVDVLSIIVEPVKISSWNLEFVESSSWPEGSIYFVDVLGSRNAKLIIPDIGTAAVIIRRHAPRMTSGVQQISKPVCSAALPYTGGGGVDGIWIIWPSVTNYFQSSKHTFLPENPVTSGFGIIKQHVCIMYFLSSPGNCGYRCVIQPLQCRECRSIPPPPPFRISDLFGNL